MIRVFRSRKLLDLIHKLPCMAQFPHDCKQYEAVEPAHSDQIKHGRGKDYKPPDWKIAAMCHTAHMALDSKELVGLKNSEWDRAHDLTIGYLFEKKLIGVL